MSNNRLQCLKCQHASEYEDFFPGWANKRPESRVGMMPACPKCASEMITDEKPKNDAVVVTETPTFIEFLFVETPQKIISKRQSHRLQIFPVDYNDLPDECVGDDWDLKLGDL